MQRSGPGLHFRSRASKHAQPQACSGRTLDLEAAHPRLDQLRHQLHRRQVLQGRGAGSRAAGVSVCRPASQAGRQSGQVGRRRCAHGPRRGSAGRRGSPLACGDSRYCTSPSSRITPSTISAYGRRQACRGEGGQRGGQVGGSAHITVGPAAQDSAPTALGCRHPNTTAPAAPVAACLRALAAVGAAPAPRLAGEALRPGGGWGVGGGWGGAGEEARQRQLVRLVSSERFITSARHRRTWPE